MSSIWDAERRLWLEGGDAFKGLLATDCVMAFGPTGILKNEAIIEGVEGAPRWTGIEFSDRSEISPAPELIIIAYRARATREDNTGYSALCTSAYVRQAGSWKIAQHQQTPVDAA